MHRLVISTPILETIDQLINIIFPLIAFVK